MKEADLQRLHTAWLQLYDILGKGKARGEDTEQCLPRVGRESVWRGRRGGPLEHRGVLGQGTLGMLLSRWIRHHTFAQTHRMYGTQREASCELRTGSDMMCQGGLISCNYCTTGVGGGGTDTGEGNVWRQKECGNISAPSSRFFYALKDEVN